MEADFAHITIGIWEHCIKVSNHTDWSKVKDDVLEIFYNSLMALWFTSQESKHRQTLCDSLCEFIMKVISSEAFLMPVRGQKRIQDSLKAMLGLLYQFVKYAPRTHDTVLKYNGIEVLNRFVKSQFSYNVKSRSTLVLAYLLTEEQQKEFDCSDNAIEFLLRILRHCLESKVDRAEMFNYTLIEVLEGR